MGQKNQEMEVQCSKIWAGGKSQLVKVQTSKVQKGDKNKGANIKSSKLMNCRRPTNEQATTHSVASPRRSCGASGSAAQ